MTQFKWSSLSFTQKFLDLIVLLAAFGAATLTTRPDLRQMSEAAKLSAFNVGLLLVVLTGWYICLSSLSIYGSRRLARWHDDLTDVLRAVGMCTLTLAALAHVFYWRGVTAEMLLAFWLLASLSLVAWRWAKRIVLRQARLHERNLRHVVIVGAGGRGQRMAEIIGNHPELGYRLIGFVDDVKTPGVIGTTDHLARILADHVVDEMFVALPLKKFYGKIEAFIRVAEEQGIVVRLHSEFFDLQLARARSEHLDELPVLTLTTGPTSNWGAACKRAIDFSGAAAALILTAPVLLAVAAAIKLTSPGPVFFAQERVGRNKQRFRMFKFRTMVTNAEALQKELEQFNEAGGPVFKMRHDPRITPIGRFLRKTSLDELPQLFNVLRGELSLVGPRPLPLRDVERFDEFWFNRRFSVKPGITCIWQVSGRSNTTFERWIKQDLEYIDNWSLLLDIKLLLKTIPAVLRGSGAM